MFTRPYISANFTKGNNFCDFLFASLGGGEILHKMGYPQELLFGGLFSSFKHVECWSTLGTSGKNKRELLI